jgi:hypothetical protein
MIERFMRRKPERKAANNHVRGNLVAGLMAGLCRVVVERCNDFIG